MEEFWWWWATAQSATLAQSDREYDANFFWGYDVDGHIAGRDDCRDAADDYDGEGDNR